jgi:hypothetical protein
VTGGGTSPDEGEAGDACGPIEPLDTDRTPLQVSSREKARYLYCSFPRAWIEAPMSPRRRIDGLAAVAPNEFRKPFGYARNPHPHYFIPGRRGQFRAQRQEQLAEAYAAIQVEWNKATSHARGGTRASASTTIWSVPAIVVYTPRLRDTSKVVLMNLHLMRSRAPAGGYLSSGWIARGLLVRRALPEYRRCYSDGVPYPFRDPRKVDDALARLRSLDIIDCNLVERSDGQVYEFRFIDGWQDRLGPMPFMPAANKVRPYAARRAAPAFPPSPARHGSATHNSKNGLQIPLNGRHNTRNARRIL